MFVTKDFALIVSDNGGGGERVLWMIVYALLSKRNDGNLAALHEIHNFDIVIYNGDKGRSKDQIITNVQVQILY